MDIREQIESALSDIEIATCSCDGCDNIRLARINVGKLMAVVEAADEYMRLQFDDLYNGDVYDKLEKALSNLKGEE